MESPHLKKCAYPLTSHIPKRAHLNKKYQEKIRSFRDLFRELLYNTEGEKLRDIVPNKLALNPLSTRDFYLGVENKIGCSDAHFMVKWKSDTSEYPPVIEAPHFSYTGKIGLSFVSSGKVLEELIPSRK